MALLFDEVMNDGVQATPPRNDGIKGRKLKQKSDGHDETLLSGWKEIANYLRCSVKTVQRWEKHDLLPIIHQSRHATVYANPLRLDQWLRLRNAGSARRIAGEFGKQLEQLQELAKRQRFLVKELQDVLRKR
jgi:hypothetical protein